MRNKFEIIYILFLLFVSMSCGRKEIESEQIEIVRLDQITAQLGGMDTESRDSVLSTHGLALSDYLYMMGLRSGDLILSADSLANSAAYSVFLPDVERLFIGEDSLKESLSILNNRLKLNDLLEFSPNYYAVISPYRQPVMLVDSMVFIAYNHYLGADYAGYSSYPRYAAEIKSPEHIKYDVAEALIDSTYPENGITDLSQRLLREGALCYAVMNVVDNASLSQYFGWTDEQLSIAEGSERMAWERLASQKLLYSTDEMDSERLFSPSPATSVISPQLPGRMGRYLGYRIVESYLSQHPDMSIKSLLTPDFYLNPASLIESGYSPK